MPRSKAIFDWIYGIATANNQSNVYQLYYLESPNVGLSNEAIAARKEREMKSLTVVETMSNTMDTLSGVWRFLNTRHDLYTASKLIERARGGKQDESTDENTYPANDMVKKSYGGS